MAKMHVRGMPPPDLNELQQSLVALVAGNERGIEAGVVRSALEEEKGIGITDDAFDDLVLGLYQQNRIIDDRITNPNRRILRLHTATEWRLPAQIGSERELEPHVEGFLWRRFGEKFLDLDLRNYSLIVQNTAHGGVAAGLWTRPDLAAAVVSRYTYAPAPQLDLYGFELKMPSGCTVYAVHEALAHTAFVNFAYLVVLLPDQAQSEREKLSRMIEQAQKHGVGIIIVKDPAEDDSYEILLAAQHHRPKLKRIDDFISQRFDRANKLALRTWIKR
jgi:hypothetical protein